MQVLRRAMQHRYRSTTLRRLSCSVRALDIRILLPKIRPWPQTSRALQNQTSHATIRMAPTSARCVPGLHETLECHAMSHAMYLHRRLGCGSTQSLPRSLRSQQIDALRYVDENVFVHRAQCAQTQLHASACSLRQTEFRHRHAQVAVDLELPLQSPSPCECHL